ncbi:hypothetical protein A0J61_11458, partial [Choanephora cucurbitarum]
MEHDDYTAPEISNHVQSWIEYAEKVRQWYFNSFLLHGEPDLSKKSVHFEPYDCSCNYRGVVRMTLYFLNGIPTIQEVEVMHCSCNPLVKQLLENHMMPNKTKSPRRAVYFALLDYLHVFKMRGLPSLSSRTALMTNDVLNSIYFLYRKLVRYAQDHVNSSYGLESMSVCLGCEGGKRKLVSMDGNFQMKRRKTAGRNEASEGGFFALSIGEQALCGTKEEVDKFATVKKDQNDNCFLDPVEDSVFKANDENSRNNSTGRYDENGIFSLSWARHGVPERMLNIYDGEGHMLKQQKEEGVRYGIMYHIICLVRENLEHTFTHLMMNDTWYGVTAIHAYAHTMACQVNYNP